MRPYKGLKNWKQTWIFRHWQVWPYLIAILCAVDCILDDEGSQALFLVFGTPLVALFFLPLLLLLIFSRAKRHAASLLGSLALFFAVFLSMRAYQDDDPGRIRSTVRWLLASRRYKREVLALPEPNFGELKHITWDAWGFVPAGNTYMYLVYDPSNSLLTAALTKASVTLPGLSCDVYRIHELESQWYTVLFYTDTNWKGCSVAGKDPYSPLWSPPNSNLQPNNASPVRP